MTYKRSIGLFAVATLAAATSAHAAVLFGDGGGNGLTYSLVQSAFASATGSMTTKSDSKSEPKNLITLPTSPVVTSLIASISDTNSGNTYSATANGTATLTLNGAGTASLRSVGSATATGVGSGDAYAQGAFGLTYYFRTTTSESFSISYLLSSSTLGCCGNQIQLDRLSGTYANILQRTIYNADNSGTLTANLAAGTYRLQISKNEYPNYDAPRISNRNGTSTIAHDDLFTFQIGTPATPAVPEPATWAMMIGGVGLVGGTLRRRTPRRKTATAR